LFIVFDQQITDPIRIHYLLINRNADQWVIMYQDAIQKNTHASSHFDDRWNSLTAEQKVVLTSLYNYGYKLLRVSYHNDRPYAVIVNGSAIEVLDPKGKIGIFTVAQSN
jgi:hypothetical protein